MHTSTRSRSRWQGSCVLPGQAWPKATSVDPVSPRRASASASLTETAPIVDINLFLEPVADAHVRVFESLQAGLVPIDAGSGSFSVSVKQGVRPGGAAAYSFTTITPIPGTDVFEFPNVLSSRGGSMEAEELGGEQRTARVSVSSFESPSGVTGGGSFGDPFQITLDAKGVVRVEVRDVGGVPVTGRRRG